MKSCFVAKGINLSCRSINGSVYIYMEDSKKILKLNEVGGFVWGQINGARTVSEIIGNCIKTYEGDEKEISMSVRNFLSILFQEKMIKLSKNKFKGVMRSV